MATETEKIRLGSGKLFMIESTDTVPDVLEICVDANRVGDIKGGAELVYTETTVVEKDDLGRRSKIVTTDEEATLKAGLLTWCGTTIQKLIDRCKSVVEGNRRVTKIGGVGNAQGKYYVICFWHEDPQDGDLYVLIVGRNSAGLTLAFATDKGAVVEPTFKAIPHDDEGTLIQLVEMLPEANEAAAASVTDGEEATEPAADPTGEDETSEV